MRTIIIVIIALVIGLVGYVSFGSKLSAPANNGSSTTSTDNGSTLSLSGRNLREVPKDTFDRTSITSLDVSHNALTGSLPAEIRHLTQLRTLDASYNTMTGVPAEIGQLRDLETINFAHNNLSGLPLELGNLKNLRTLDFRANPNISRHDIELIQKQIPQTTVMID